MIYYVGDFILYVESESEYVGQIYEIRGNYYKVVVELALTDSEWDTITEIYDTQIIQKLTLIKSINDQLKDFYPELLV